MIVMKFGGTSVADARAITALGTAVAHARSEQPLVVVSALSGVTEQGQGTEGMLAQVVASL